MYVLASPTRSKLRPSRARFTPPEFALGGIAETSGQALTIFAVLVAMFRSKDRNYDHFYLSFVSIIWIAMRQGIRRVVIGLLVTTFGIVVAMHLFPTAAVVFSKIALLMLVLSAVGLIVGSEVSERPRLAAGEVAAGAPVLQELYSVRSERL
jgi:hypothetical protein